MTPMEIIDLRGRKVDLSDVAMLEVRAMFRGWVVMHLAVGDDRMQASKNRLVQALNVGYISHQVSGFTVRTHNGRADFFNGAIDNLMFGSPDPQIVVLEGASEMLDGMVKESIGMITPKMGFEGVIIVTDKIG